MRDLDAIILEQAYSDMLIEGSANKEFLCSAKQIEESA